ncbi:hypothetical protein D3C84_835860 [compost metagenome]
MRLAGPIVFAIGHFQHARRLEHLHHLGSVKAFSNLVFEHVRMHQIGAALVALAQVSGGVRHQAGVEVFVGPDAVETV